MKYFLILTFLLIGCTAPKKAVKAKIITLIPHDCITNVDYSKAHCEIDDKKNTVCKQLQLTYVQQCAMSEVKH